MNGPVVVVGAGPAGSLMATYLARQGHDVIVYESRPDLRTTELDAGRSINLALATRGIVPLVDIGAIERVDEITIPMKGRAIHAVDNPSVPAFQNYGVAPHEVVHSVGRSDLNAILLDAAEATGKVTIEFESAVERVDLDNNLLHFADGGTAPFGVVFGADGAGSPVRTALVDKGVCDYHVEWLDHDYKELELPPNDDGSHKIDPHALHIWPRGEFMLIALANPEGDFTVTLFAPKATFAELTSEAKITAFFDEQFPDFAGLVPDLAEQFVRHPAGILGTVRAVGWSYEDKAIVLGDAAHGVVPFHGQGMNAAMESARELDRFIRENPDDLATAFVDYETERRPNTDAIANMAIDNYVEMRAGVIDPDYLARRNLAVELAHRHPQHITPRYNMVMFYTMGYAEAQQRALEQGELIKAAIADPSLDIDAMVAELPPLPANDPLALPDALSIS